MPHSVSLIHTIAAALGLALALGFLATRLRLPALVGYLLAGVAIGPFTPGFVADAAMASQLAEIGVMLLMFGVGLGLSGVAGCLLSMAYTISPSMGEPYTVTALIVITLGGFGSMGGALAGGLLLGVIEALGMHFTNPSLKALLSYVVFIGVLLLRPEGLFARKTRKA